ncbi:uncharacterized protein LOC144286683 isoform X1 [Canis aureus]
MALALRCACALALVCLALLLLLRPRGALGEALQPQQPPGPRAADWLSNFAHFNKYLEKLFNSRKLPTPQEPHQQTPRNPYQRMLRNPPDRPPGNPNLRPPPRAPGRRAWAGWYLSGAPELGAGGSGQRGSPGLCGADTRAPGTSFSRQGPDLHLPDSSLLAHPPPLYSSGSLNSYLLTFLTTTYPETIKKYLHGLVTPVGPRQEGI